MPDNLDPQDNQDPNNAGNGGNGGVGVATPPAGGAVDWRSMIDQEYRQDPALEKFKSPNDLYKSYKNLEKFVGRDKMILPKDENDKEAWDQVFEKIGRPTDAKGYKLPEVEVSEQTKAMLTKEGVQGYLEFAHGIGLNNKQASALFEWHLKQTDAGVMQSGEARQKMMQDSETELRRDLGGAYNERMALAQKVFQAFKTDKDISFFQEHGNDPRLLRFLVNVGAKMSEDTLGPGAPKGLTKTPAEAESEYMSILHDMKHPYHNSDHPEHELAKQKVEALILAAYGGKK